MTICVISTRCVTGSYDRTARIWDAEKGNELHILRGHENAVFSVQFNYPKWLVMLIEWLARFPRINNFFSRFRSDRIITGSFDKTAKIWNPYNGMCLQTFYGHTSEVIAAEMGPTDQHLLATASMDFTARLFHVETGQQTHVLRGHNAEVITARFNSDSNLLLTGSFDNRALIWDVRSRE